MLRSRLPLALAAVAVLAISACGGGSDEDTAGPAASATAGAFPVTVAHKYGTTEIKSAPTRVVTLGLSDQDTALALGVKPVGAVDWFKERPYGKWPWAQPLWGGTAPEIVGERDEFNFEKIAALKPDLIIAQYSGMTKENYDTLSQIAPTVGQPKEYGDYLAPWQAMTLAIGKALGKQAQTEELIAGIDKKFADVRQQHPDWAGKTVAVVDPFEPGQYAVFSSTDPKLVFLKEMGFTVPAEIDKLAGKENATVISSERLDLIDVDRLLFLTSDPGAEKRVTADKVYAGLKVAQEKRAVFLPYEEPPLGGALSFNTVLSIPYAIDQVVPILAGGTGK
ncbi:iron-siderophore ABC transporter substrate-binding protein [Phytohabitans rumicis]|uniref:iron-siderophore ABC transporter substrate-binding protein n=1 Tax=Phytohabitans rumicis TaxID=1076125 RepID=UPI001562EC87|nr:iron-siderophore ABC transporter substrate-binding protein [Phytohabitans rumicis]